MLIEDIGLLPGAMKLLGEGGTSYADVMLGDAKSSIWLFKMIPVEGDMNLQPQIRLTEAVTRQYTYTTQDKREQIMLT